MKNKFNGTNLVAYNPKVNILNGDFGREFLEEYNGKIRLDYKGNENLRVLEERDNIIKGSNSFAVVLANEILSQESLRTATQPDLELILRYRRDLTLKNAYEDTGLVLRSESNPNDYLAKDLAKQLRERRPGFKYPILINLSDLSLRVDQDSNYGLSFRLKEEARPIYAPILNSNDVDKFNSSDVDESIGLPRQIGVVGERYLSTRSSAGLSRFSLGNNLGLNSDDDALEHSNFSGLIVVVSRVATQEIINLRYEILQQSK